MKYQLAPVTALFNEEGFTENAGWLKIYYAYQTTLEFWKATYEYVAEGVMLPEYASLTAPARQANDNEAILLKDGNWIYVEDLRGQIIYSKKTGEESIVKELGEISDDYTKIKPQTKFDAWDGEKWITDAKKQHEYDVDIAKQIKSSLEEEVKEKISLIQDAIDSEIATKEEIESLTSLKKYRVLLNRVDVNDAPNINWPEKPF